MMGSLNCDSVYKVSEYLLFWIMLRVFFLLRFYVLMKILVLVVVVF